MATPLFASDTPAGKILAYLQRHGEATIKDLEEMLQISTTAVREHLTHIQAKELVETRLVRRGPGRPHLVYFLTSKAQSLFPKAYAPLVSTLLHEITSSEGEERAQRLLDAVGERLAEDYQTKVSGDNPEERLDTLRSALESRGIPAETGSDRASLQVFSCPYFDVAREHASICTMDRRMLERILGASIRTEGTIREGRHSCQFKIVNKT